MLSKKLVLKIAQGATNDVSQLSSGNRCARKKTLNQAAVKWAYELGHFLRELGREAADRQTVCSLASVCQLGGRYGARLLSDEANVSILSSLARKNLQRELERVLAQVTRPCLGLFSKAAEYATQAVIDPISWDSESKQTRSYITEKKVYERLIFLFNEFPVLAKLWYEVISQWLDTSKELLDRLRRDRQVLSDRFFNGLPLGDVINLRSGLSDRHNMGRTVTLLEFKIGAIIYKPRSGNGEREWTRLIESMNSRGFRPKLRAARTQCRTGYCWMSVVRASPCKNQQQLRRFYTRIGGMIALTYLLKTVDCHRQNLIACGEWPFLVDTETLAHPSSLKDVNSGVEVLYRLGFLPAPGSDNATYRRGCSLANSIDGLHKPRIRLRTINAVNYETEIIRGFKRAWSCLLSQHRAVPFVWCFAKAPLRLRRIYRQTQTYDLIRAASIQPAALRSARIQDKTIRRLISHNRHSDEIISAEIAAIKRFDIPRFTQVIRPVLRIDKIVPPKNLIQHLRGAIRSL
jgi:lantibiotic modifying enzyme